MYLPELRNKVRYSSVASSWTCVGLCPTHTCAHMSRQQSTSRVEGGGAQTPPPISERLLSLRTVGVFPAARDPLPPAPPLSIVQNPLQQ